MEKQGGQEGRKRAGFRAPDKSNSDRIAKGKSARQKQQRSRGGGEKRQTKATAIERRRGNRGKPMERRPGNADDLLPLLPFSSSSSCFSCSSSFSYASLYSYSSCMGSRASSISP